MTFSLSRHVRQITRFDIIAQTTGRLPAVGLQIVFGLGCTALTVSTRALLNVFALAAGPYALAYPAILVATLFGRSLSGFTAFVSWALLIRFYFLPGERFSGSVSAADEPRFTVDVLIMLFILVFAEIFRRAICEANESLAKVDERTKALLVAEAALRQSQSMEAVGQLTGGLAHGFNNLIAGISGNLELLERRIIQGRAADAPPYIGAAQDAARRAASLTQRLLAFSRHQTLDPRPTDVNNLATGMLELIRRTVGPAISVGVVGAPELWATTVDPWQLEVALLNLCINARDAMAPNGGRLTIETDNVLASEFAEVGHAVSEDRYVVVRVSDTGVGMSPEMVARAFDPFFTTKPIGQGTGLGLSMVYGFVRQSGGHVSIDSTPGKGTTVNIFLPRNEGTTETLDKPTFNPSANVNGATILVIDDEPTVRDFVVEVLDEEGYNTLEAGDGPRAMQFLRSGAKIDLLIVDIGLPGGMSGRQVADAARLEIASLKVLFMTGYPENVALNGEQLARDAAMITKPFTVSDIVGRVRALLAE